MLWNKDVHPLNGKIIFWERFAEYLGINRIAVCTDVRIS